MRLASSADAAVVTSPPQYSKGHAKQFTGVVGVFDDQDVNALKIAVGHWEPPVGQASIGCAYGRNQ
jgi:hypothetical protein